MLFAEWDEGGHRGMVEKAHELIESADVIIHYNGVSFDRKWLNTEFKLAGLQPPAPAKDVDLLSVARKQFMLPSRKLEYVAPTFGCSEKLQHSGMPMWNAILHGDGEERDKARRLMARYCKQDVRTTESLYLELLPWIDNHVNAGLFIDEDEPVCVNCGSEVVRRGWAYTTHARYRRFKCKNDKCGRWLRSRRSDQIAELRSA